MSDQTNLPPMAGDVWRDLDPRGGPTFRVVYVDPPDIFNGRAEVTNLDGKRKRTVLLERFRASANYRSGYTLVSRIDAPRASLPQETPTEDET